VRSWLRGGDGLSTAPRAPETHFRPIDTRSVITALLLSAQLILALLLGGAQTQRLVFLKRIAAGTRVQHADLVASDWLILILSRLSLAMAVATAVAFLSWFHRAHENLRSFRAGPFTFTPAEAVWSFFVPFLNLVRPYEAMREIWQASDPKLPLNADAPYADSGVGWLVPTWWALFVGRGAVSWIAVFNRFGAGANKLEALVASTQSFILAQAINVPAAAAAILVVYLVDRRQDALAGICEELAAGTRESACTGEVSHGL
jgi:hypothetical protein